MTGNQPRAAARTRLFTCARRWNVNHPAMLRFCLALFLGVVALSAAPKPNFLVIVADDLGYMDVTSYAARMRDVPRDQTYYETPHIDRLAAESQRLTDALAFPYLMLLVSGGHCQFLNVHGPDSFTRLGGTIDDAPGEAFVAGTMIRGTRELLSAVLRDIVFTRNEVQDSGAHFDQSSPPHWRTDHAHPLQENRQVGGLSLPVE